MTASTRLKLRKLVKYAVATQVIAWVMIAFNGSLPSWHSFGWGIVGVWIGFLEEFTFGRRFRALPIPVQIIGKTVLVNLFTLALLSTAFIIDKERVISLMDIQNVNYIQAFSSPEFGRVLVRTFIVTVAVLLTIQMEEVFGRRSFLGALMGSYDRPRQEEKVIMTMDLVGSTALAEQMGDMRYFDLLNFTYSLMTDPILRNEAVILKYIGDEVIFIWSMKNGLRDLNCLDLYYDIMDRIKKHEQIYISDFGVVPKYRGAIHCGPVITARIGHIKRTVDLSGDVMNTVSRMLDLCKQLNEDLLVSTRLLARTQHVEERFVPGPARLLKIRGKKNELPVHAIKRLQHGLGGGIIEGEKK